jgi:translation initiation factor 1
MSRKNKTDKHGFVYSTDPHFNFEHEENSVDTLPPSQQKLKVRLDSKQRAGKVVTLIEGFVGKGEDLQELGKKLKTFCGSGGSVKDREIILQGDQAEKALQWLVKNGYSRARRS